MFFLCPSPNPIYFSFSLFISPSSLFSSFFTHGCHLTCTTFSLPSPFHFSLSTVPLSLTSLSSCYLSTVKGFWRVGSYFFSLRYLAATYQPWRLLYNTRSLTSPGSFMLFPLSFYPSSSPLSLHSHFCSSIKQHFHPQLFCTPPIIFGPPLLCYFFSSIPVLISSPTFAFVVWIPLAWFAFYYRLFSGLPLIMTLFPNI